MKRLLLLRHGKAVPHDEGRDFDRGLTARGISDSAAMGNYLAHEHIIPDMALISPAERTKMTWEAAKTAFGSPIDERFDPTLYLASSDTLRRAIYGVKDRVGTLILIGHNPSLHDLALELVGFGDRYALARLKEHFPTASVVVLDCDIDHWSDLAPRLARLDRFRTPVPADEP